MAEMSGTKSKTPKRGKLSGIRIEIKGNGFEVTKSYEPVMGKKDSYPIYAPEGIKDSMVFETWEKTKEYLDKCVGGDAKSEEYAEGEA